MARMIPSVISPEIKSSAERRVFEWFRDDPQTGDWIVLHSLGIANHNKVIYGETDFFVLAPRLGLFALEVKGGRVKRESGIWLYTNKYGKVNSKSRGPFEQAYDGAFSIIKSIKSKLDYDHKHIKNVFWGIGVMFPDIEYRATGIDEEQWQVFDYNDGRDVSSFIHRLFDGSKQNWEKHYGNLDPGKLPKKDDIEYIATILRGDFDMAVSMYIQLKYAEEALLELTREQYRCLDQLNENYRCLIQGFAGTGKTLLAVEEAKRASANGERVALFCYNANLGEWLSKYFSMFSNALRPVYIGTFHKFVMRILRENGVSFFLPTDENDFPDFFTVDIPEAAINVLEQVPGQFDRIIIDEAQDLIHPQYLDIFDQLLHGGLEHGKWTMFGDFSRQAIYAGNRSGVEMREFLKERSSFINFKLTLNCRNTKPICDEIQTVTGFVAPVQVWTKVEGPPVNYITYGNDEEEKERLESLLEFLVGEGVSKGDITILSPVKRTNSIVSQVDSFEILDLRENSDEISFCTIHGYKGLENTVIILTDINSFSSERIMYIGLSRARSGLYVLISKNAQKEYQGFQRRRFNLV